MTDDAVDPAPRAAGTGPPPPSVAFLLASLGRTTRDLVEARLAEHGLSFQHLSVLGHLQRQPGLSYSELARRAGVTVQSMQTTVGQLQARGLVDPGARARQGRRAELSVTADGRRLRAVGDEAVRAVDAELLAGLTPAEVEDLEGALLRLFLGRARARADGSAPGTG